MCSLPPPAQCVVSCFVTRMKDPDGQLADDAYRDDQNAWFWGYSPRMSYVWSPSYGSQALP